MSTETAIREALSAGPTEGWTLDKYGTVVFGPRNDTVCLTGFALATGYRPQGDISQINRDFVLACNPTAIRSLLADLDTLRQRAEKAEEALDACLRHLKVTSYHHDKDRLFKIIEDAIAARSATGPQGGTPCKPE